VIDRVAYVEIEEVPEDLGGRSRYVWRTVDGNPIALERVGQGEWLFSSETLDRLPNLWASVKDADVVEGVEAAPQTPAMWLRNRMPETLRQRGFLLERWQWLAFAVLIFLGVVVERVLTFFLVRIVAGHLTRLLASRRVENAVIQVAMRPLGVVAMAVGYLPVWGWAALPSPWPPRTRSRTSSARSPC